MSTSETITRTDLANILNEVLPSTAVDYIVEQGTNYRKWNSGLAECWGTGTIGSNSACSVNLPITLASTSDMVVTASCEYNASLTYIAPTISVQKYTDHLNLYARVSTSTVPAGYTVNWSVKGRWK